MLFILFRSPLSKMPVDVAYDRAHVVIIVVRERGLFLPQDLYDASAKIRPNAFPGILLLKTAAAAFIRKQPLFERRSGHVDGFAKLSPNLFPIDLSMICHISLQTHPVAHIQ